MFHASNASPQNSWTLTRGLVHQHHHHYHASITYTTRPGEFFFLGWLFVYDRQPLLAGCHNQRCLRGPQLVMASRYATPRHVMLASCPRRSRRCCPESWVCQRLRGPSPLSLATREMASREKDNASDQRSSNPLTYCFNLGSFFVVHL